MESNEISSIIEMLKEEPNEAEQPRDNNKYLLSSIHKPELLFAENGTQFYFLKIDKMTEYLEAKALQDQESESFQNNDDFKIPNNATWTPSYDEYVREQYFRYNKCKSEMRFGDLTLTAADFVAANVAASSINSSGNITGNLVGNVTGTIQTAAQTNITSVGTLSSLAVSGTSAFTGAATTSYTTIGASAKAMRNVFIHSSAPGSSDGAVGDIWITYS